MDEAQRRAAGISRPTWISAERQTAPRGRRGRPWQSARASFAATLVLPEPGTALEAAQRSFLAAVALRDRVAAELPEAEITLKWPNDLLVNGRKAAGILLETIGGGARPAHLSIGIGLNLEGAPDASSLEPDAVAPIALDEAQRHKIMITQGFFLTYLAVAVAHLEGQFRRDGFAPIRAAWMRHAAGLGGPIRARVGAAEHHGRFDGIDETGALILETEAGRMVLSAGDIYI